MEEIKRYDTDELIAEYMYNGEFETACKSLDVEKSEYQNKQLLETVEDLQKRLKEFAETISLFDSQADQCPKCGIWRTEEMKEHMPNCTVNKIDEWLDGKPEI